MANVTFKNKSGRDSYLHMRIGPVDKDPAERGSSNTVLKPGTSADIPVDDGDVWYCFGNQQVNDSDDPQLCNAAGGATVELKTDLPCYANN